MTTLNARDAEDDSVEEPGNQGNMLASPSSPVNNTFEMFVGEGLADTSVCSVASVCSSISQPITEEDLIDSIFHACDTSRRGQVPVSSLLEYIKVAIHAEECEDSADLDDLWMMFDANGMDVLVTHETYRQIMAEWVCRLRRASGCLLHRSQNCTDLIEFSPGLPPPCSPIPNNVPLHSLLSPTCSSPGVNEPFALANYTIGSLEGTAGDRSSLDEIVLVTEMSELQFQNKKLQEKLQKLHAQLASTEDQNINLLSERDELVKKLDSFQLIMEKNKAAEKECLELCNCVAKMEEALLLSREKIEALEKENSLLESRNKDLREDLKSAYAESEDAKIYQDQLQQSLEETTLNLDTTEEKMKQNEFVCEQHNARIKELEASLKEWMQMAKDLKLGKLNLENKLSEVLDASVSIEQQWRLKESIEIARQSGNVNVSTVRNPAKRPKLDAGCEPDNSSDGSMKSSLHAELHSFVEQNENLPSPFCEKHIVGGVGNLADNMQSRRHSLSLRSSVRRRLFQIRPCRNKTRLIEGDERLWSNEFESDTDDGVSVDEEPVLDDAMMHGADVENGNERDSGFEIEMSCAVNMLMVAQQNANSGLQLALNLSFMVLQTRGHPGCTSPLPQASSHAPWTEVPPLEDGVQAVSKVRLDSIGQLHLTEPHNGQKFQSPSKKEITKSCDILDHETDVTSQLKMDLKTATLVNSPTDFKDMTKELSILCQTLAKTQAVLYDVLKRTSATSAAVVTTTAINLPFANMGRKEDTDFVPSETTDCSPEHHSESFLQYSTLPRLKFGLQSEHLHQAKTQSLDQDRSLSPSSICLRCHHRVLSCPVLPSQISLVTKGTQTDLSLVDSQGGIATARNEQSALLSKTEMSSKQEIIRQEGSDSNDARRLRSNSFLAAVNDGKLHLTDFISEEDQLSLNSMHVDELQSSDMMRESCHGPRKLSILHEEDHEDPCPETAQIVPVPFPKPASSQTPQSIPPPYRPPPSPPLYTFSRSTPQLSQVVSHAFATHSLEDLHLNQAGPSLSRTFSIPRSSFSVENRPPLQKRFSVDLGKSDGNMDESSQHLTVNPQPTCIETTQDSLPKLIPTKQREVELNEVQSKADSVALINCDRRGNRRRRLAFAGLTTGSAPLIKRSLAVELDEPETSTHKTTLRTSRPVSTFKSQSSHSHSSTSCLMMDLKASETDSSRESVDSVSELEQSADGNHVLGSSVAEEAEIFERSAFSEGILRDLSVNSSSKKYNKSSAESIDKLNEEDIEYEFRRLTLGIHSAQATVHLRLDRHQRQRDLAEDDVRKELNILKENLKSLELDVLSNEVSMGREIHHFLCTLQQQVDVILRATTKVSACSAVFGAIQQEQRVGNAVAIMVQYVENVRRQCEKLQNELEEMRKSTTFIGNNCPKFSDTLGSSPKALLQMHPSLGRRRASIAGHPRSSPGDALGWCMYPNLTEYKGGSPEASSSYSVQNTPGCARLRSSSAVLSPSLPDSCTPPLRMIKCSGWTAIEKEEEGADLSTEDFFPKESAVVTSKLLDMNVTTDTESSKIFTNEDKKPGDELVAMDVDILNSVNSSFHLSRNFSNAVSCIQACTLEEKSSSSSSSSSGRGGDEDNGEISVEYLRRSWQPSTKVKSVRWWLKMLPAALQELILCHWEEMEMFTFLKHVAGVILMLGAVWILLSSFLPCGNRSSAAAKSQHLEWISWEEILQPYLALRHHGRPPT